jgi:hypothetical protein
LDLYTFSGRTSDAGYGDTGQMWSALAPVLAKTHTVIVPDIPGLGNSRPENPVTKLALMDGPIPGVGPWQTVLLFSGNLAL